MYAHLALVRHRPGILPSFVRNSVTQTIGCRGRWTRENQNGEGINTWTVGVIIYKNAKHALASSNNQVIQLQIQ